MNKISVTIIDNGESDDVILRVTRGQEHVFDHRVDQEMAYRLRDGFDIERFLNNLIMFIKDADVRKADGYGV